SMRRLSAPLLRGANRLDQNQLLHSFSRASQKRSPSQTTSKPRPYIPRFACRKPLTQIVKPRRELFQQTQFTNGTDPIQPSPKKGAILRSRREFPSENCRCRVPSFCEHLN